MTVEHFDKDLFEKKLRDKVTYAEEVLLRHLPKEKGFQKKVIEAMNYSVTAGGKRLRPVLMRETYLLFGGKDTTDIEPFMAAVEMIHNYSLVHDDLPAMDNDEYRRGKKTTWAVYGDDFGILAGDGLLNFAFETAVSALDLCFEHHGEEEPATEEVLEKVQRVSRALKVLAQKAGIYGMIGGQTADIEAEKQEQPISEEQLIFIHAHKTAALIQASMMIGAILAGAKDEDIKNIETCAYNIGLAFQIQDDILDVIGDSEELGKPVGSDEQNHKQTYVTLKGLEVAKLHVEQLSREAIALVGGLTGEDTFLAQLIFTLIHRTK